MKGINFENTKKNYKKNVDSANIRGITFHLKSHPTIPELKCFFRVKQSTVY